MKALFTTEDTESTEKGILGSFRPRFVPKTAEDTRQR